MIWPFKPRAPLPLVQKVHCERRFAAAAQAIGVTHVVPGPILATQDLDALIGNCELGHLPRQLFEFFSKRLIVPNPDIEVDWNRDDPGTISATEFEFHQDTDDQITGLTIHPTFAKFPYRLASVVLAGMSCWRLNSRFPNSRFPAGTMETLPLLYGMGPIMANAAYQGVSEFHGKWESWEAHRTGSVSAIEYGYTMALADWKLQTSYHDVRADLRQDAKEGLEYGIQFLQKTGDTCLSDDFPNHQSRPHAAAICETLRQGSLSQQLGTLYDLQPDSVMDAELTDSIGRLLGHHKLEMRKAAVDSLRESDSLPPELHDEIHAMAKEGRTETRMSAIQALRPGYADDDQVISTLVGLLDRSDSLTSAACIRTLLKYDRYADFPTGSLLNALATMVPTSELHELSEGIELLRRLVEDPQAEIQNRFSHDPTELAVLSSLMEDGDTSD